MSRDVIEELIGAFRSLSGVGYKTAQRYADQILMGSDEQAQKLANAIIDAKHNVKFCKICGGYSTRDECDICTNRKDSKMLCVVEQPRDISYMEKVNKLNCVYHVLHGCISPLNNKSPKDIHIKELLHRLQKGNYTEVLIATNPDVEGEATAMYIAKLIKPLGIKVTRLAQGLSLGSNLEYADEVTLLRAIETRHEM